MYDKSEQYNIDIYLQYNILDIRGIIAICAIS